MISKIKENVWRFKFDKFGSYVYLIRIKEKNILIDTGSFFNRNQLIEDLKKLNISSEQIETIILTHHHFDHTQNKSLFKNAKIFGSKKDFPQEEVKDIKKMNIKEFKLIETPGHSKGSICILYKDILFSGDTLFHRNTIGRTDLPGSSEKEMQESLKKLSEIKFKILCPGHGCE